MFRSTRARSRRVRLLVTIAAIGVITAGLLGGASAANAATTTVVTPAFAEHAVSCAYSPAKPATKTTKAVAAVRMCLAVGGPTGKRTWARFNGTSWSRQGGIYHVGASVSCVTPRFCVAVGDTDFAVYNGSAWTTPKAVPSVTASLSSVSCSKTTFCVAVGRGSAGDFATAFNGTTWGKSSTIIKGSTYAPAVSCTTSLCMAVDGNSSAVERAGAWTSHSVANAIQLTAVSCAGSARCVLTDLYGSAIVWNGTTFTAVSSPSEIFTPFDSVSCSSTAFCMIGGTDATQSKPQLYALSGNTLGPATTPKTATNTNTVSGVACLSSALCAVAAENVPSQA